MADTAELTAQLEKQSVAQLKEQLTKYDLDTKGKKALLIARLVDHSLTSSQNDADPDKEEEELEELLGNGDTEEVIEDVEETEESMDTDQVKEDAEEEVVGEEVEKGEEEKEEEEEKGEEEKGEEEKGEEEKGEKEDKDMEEEGDAPKEDKKGDTSSKPPPSPDTFIYNDKEDLYTAEEMAEAEVVYGNLVKEIRDKFQSKRMCVYPVAAEDLTDATLREILKKCSFYSLHFRCGQEGEVETLQGYLEMTTLGQEDAATVKEELKQWSEELTVQIGTDIDLPNLVKDNPLFAVPPPKRTICVAGIPENATESQLLELFHGFQAIISHDKDGKVNGRGFVEFSTEEDATGAVESGRAMTWEEKNLHVFRVWDTPGRVTSDKPVDVARRAQEVAQRRLDLVHQWETHTVDDLDGKIDDIEQMEKELEEEEARLDRDGLAAPKRWRQYIKVYLASRSTDIYVHLKHHLSLTIGSLRQKLVIRNQRQKDRVGKPHLHAKKIQRKSEKWQEKTGNTYRGGMKRPYSSGSPGRGAYAARSPGYGRAPAYGARESTYADKRPRMAMREAAYGYARPQPRAQSMGFLGNLIREHSWQGESRSSAYPARGRQHYY